MQHCIPSRVTYFCDKFETKIFFQLIRITIQHFAGEPSSESTKLLGPEYNYLLGEYLSIKRLEQSIFNESYIHAHVHFVIIFKFLISHQLLFLSSYKTWKDQISDIGAGCVNKTYHDLSIRRNGCSALVRMPADKGMSYDTKNTNTSQERNNFSVDMEEESSDMDKFKYVW